MVCAQLAAVLTSLEMEPRLEMGLWPPKPPELELASGPPELELVLVPPELELASGEPPELRAESRPQPSELRPVLARARNILRGRPESA